MAQFFKWEQTVNEYGQTSYTRTCIEGEISTHIPQIENSTADYSHSNEPCNPNFRCCATPMLAIIMIILGTCWTLIYLNGHNWDLSGSGSLPWPLVIGYLVWILFYKSSLFLFHKYFQERVLQGNLVRFLLLNKKTNFTIE
jgi:hypothetical protein